MILKAVIKDYHRNGWYAFIGTGAESEKVTVGEAVSDAIGRLGFGETAEVIIWSANGHVSRSIKLWYTDPRTERLTYSVSTF